MTASKEAYVAAREGMSVRATCGRFERDLTEFAEAVPRRGVRRMVMVAGQSAS